MVVATLNVVACASRGSSSPFIIRKGDGPVHVGNVGHVGHVPLAERQKADQARHEAVMRRAAERPAALPTIERLDGPLREALAALAREESAQAHVAVAWRYWDLGVYDAAYDHYSDAIRLEPKDATAWDGRARVWRHWHLIEPALSDVHRALFYAPRRADVRNTLGTILEAAGQCSEARVAYEDALTLDPSAVWAKANLDRLACARSSDPIPAIGGN
jgi:tetratricopeptide (TPR) repeat protein